MMTLRIIPISTTSENKRYKVTNLKKMFQSYRHEKENSDEKASKHSA